MYQVSQAGTLPAHWSAIDALPGQLFTAETVRQIDAYAIEQLKIPAIQLMKRAGRAAFELLQARWPELSVSSTLSVVCGKGNNAGDGYIVAMLAKERGWKVVTYELSSADALSPVAQQAREAAAAAEVTLLPYERTSHFSDGVIVDALLGTGVRGAVSENYTAVIKRMNESGLPVVALDLPSGVDSDTGAVLCQSKDGKACYAVKAVVTVTFIAVKRGLVTGQAVDYVGELIYANLSLPSSIVDAFKACSVHRLGLFQMPFCLNARLPSAHKNRFGHVLVIGGDYGMAGAVILAARAALRMGSGLVSVATRMQHVGAIVSAQPEIMSHGVSDLHGLSALMAKADTIVLGPGLGQSAWSRQLFFSCLEYASSPSNELALIMDADALNLLSQMKKYTVELPSNTVITPHPAEAARLLACETWQVQADRFSAIKQLFSCLGATVVLKGAGTLVAFPDQFDGVAHGESVSLCPYGNPGMATAGMGDVLSGIIAGLMAQGLNAASAAQAGVCLHAAAGDQAAECGGQRGVAAGDIVEYARGLLNSILAAK